MANKNTRINPSVYPGRLKPDPMIRYRRFQEPEDYMQIANLCQAYWDALELDYITLPDEVERSFKYLEHFNLNLNVRIAERQRRPIGYALVNWY